ncbi:hypothetical protein KGA66_22025 [Actinocrinis puniceicyclus]|uniref:Lysoplasmalogenase n=1 Tax=Actinocrinis puniceicyclus TaxID=977794 RepID=A0A8J7WNM4_9ACTN|nr:lysoplasmalogenase family protein [Actinocrinis puniceicyclus]MBS2965746.1 hypothetical protein [Actinocrinis puniceicyclus]
MNRLPAARRALPLLYAGVAAADLLAIAARVPALGWVSKPLLAPLLALALVRAGTPVRSSMVAGLACAAIGDSVLMIPGTAAFIAGMAAFLAMHACYIRAFLRSGSGGAGRGVAAAYSAVWLVANALLLTRTGALAPAIALYSAALLAMAATARRLGRLGMLGGTLFVVSDGLIGAATAGLNFPGRSLLTMATYIAAQALLARGYAQARTAEAERRVEALTSLPRPA